MHNKPHTAEARAKMSAALRGKRRKWGQLPELDIVRRLLETDATTRSLAAEFGCSDSTIKAIFRRHATPEQRLQTKIAKQAAALKGYKHPPEFGRAHSERVSGEKNPFFGKSHTEEFKASQSGRKKGKAASLEIRVLQSARLQGVSLSEWRGFVSSENERQRRTPRYAAWRLAVFERDDFTCRMCGQRGRHLHPHHIKRFSSHPELRFEVANGVTLCADPCHRKTVGKEESYEHLFVN